MKKLKRFIGLLLSSLLFAGILVGCNAAGKNENDSDQSQPKSLSILYPGDETDRMTEFLSNEFAEAMKKDLNLEVKVTFVPWDQYWEQKDIMLAAQEDIDLYWDGLPDLSTMVNKKQCLPLDDLIEQYGQDMLKVLPMEQIRGGEIDGTIYGIPTAYAPSSGMFQLVCVRQDILEAVGMSEIKTPEDLETFALKAKKQFPEMKGGADPLFKPLTRYYTEEQYHWIASQELVVFGEESHRAYSYYETEAFQELSKFNRKLNNQGLYNDDVTIKYNERDSRMQTGLYLWVEGSLGKENEIIAAVQQNAPEAKLKSYLLAPEKPRYINAAGGEVMCVPNSAKNPEGAIQFLNWLYASQDHYNLALYGVKDVDYTIENGRITRINGDEFFYEWMFRNQNYQMFGPETDQAFIDEYKHWDDNAIQSASFGFAFNNEKVKDIETRLNEAAKNFAAIRSGFVDFETEYPKAVALLKESGIDEYVAEVQRQLDEFLASKSNQSN